MQRLRLEAPSGWMSGLVGPRMHALQGAHTEERPRTALRACYKGLVMRVVQVPGCALAAACDAMERFIWHTAVGQACLPAVTHLVVMLRLWPTATWCVPEACIIVTHIPTTNSSSIPCFPHPIGDISYTATTYRRHSSLPCVVPSGSTTSSNGFLVHIIASGSTTSSIGFLVHIMYDAMRIATYALLE